MAGLTQTFTNVFVNHEALIFRRGRIYPESFAPGTIRSKHYRHPSRYGWFLAKNYGLRRGEKRVPSGLWVIDNHSPNNYYHWMVDVLPRLLAAEREHPDEHVLLLPRYYRRNPYIEFTLACFPHIEQLGWIPAHYKIRVQDLAYVRRQTDEERQGQLLEIASRLRNLVGGPGESSPRRVYFTRGDGRRSTTNEAEVVQVLREHDVEVYRIDPSRPWEQVQVSAGASLMVGVHGAALTNVVLMSPGGRVIEFRHPHDTFHDVYRPLAEIAGVTYVGQKCQPVQPKGVSLINADLVVDLDLLRENLRQATDPSSGVT